LQAVELINLKTFMKNFSLLLLAGMLCFANVGAQNVDSLMLKKHVYLLASDSLMGRGFGMRGGRMASEYITRQFESAGLKPWEGKYIHPFIKSGMMIKTEGANIIGWVEGSDSLLKNEYIVLGAHYDHLGYKIVDSDTIVYNGADDNASGVASIIEIGRWLVQNRDKLKRSVILVAFDGEEAGLIGSSYMVKNNVIPIKQVKFMFSLDMVGMLGKYGGIDLVGNETLSGGDEFFSQLASMHDIIIKKTGGRIEPQTDTWPFGKAGVPSVHVFTSTVSPYHQPTDDAYRLDYMGMAKIASFVSDVTVKLSNLESLKPENKFTKATAGKNTFVTGISFGAGRAFHLYDDEFYQSKVGFAFNIGLYSQFRLSRSFDLQVEAKYLNYSTTHTYGKFRTHDIFVPVSMLYYLNGRSDSQLFPNLFLIWGGNYSYRLSTKVGDGTYSSANFKDHSYGLQFGLGFSIMNANIQMVRYSALSSIDRNVAANPNYFLFSIGVNF
jgi:hypothetical protein